MASKILVAGATGNLGNKIVDKLLISGANVVCIVRKQTDRKKIKKLREKGVTILAIDITDVDAVALSCVGVDCVVSALSGLRNTIIDTQKIIVEGAIKAGVKRFIPSDFSFDFTNLIPGKNRNLDLRREFHGFLDKMPIKSTTIFNGPFMDLLTTDMPLIMFKKNKILCWGNPNVKIDFTTTHNIAEYTALAALDNDTPRYLKIAGDTLSANDFKSLMTQISGNEYKLFRPGGISLLDIVINIAKLADRKKTELYPAWQGMQYMRDMMEGRAVLNDHDNNRYPIKWTSVKEFLLSENAK